MSSQPAQEKRGRIMQITIQDRILHEHSQLQSRLSEWEAALAQLNTSVFSDSQHGLQRVWRLVPFFERELPRQFQEEEVEWFPAIEASQPDANTAVARFVGEHAEITHQWQDYKRELLYCDAVGDTRRVYELGSRLVCLLRRHLQSEEAAFLLPATGT